MTHIFTKAENDAWMKTLPGIVTSACVALIHNETVLMVKANYKKHWTFPGGIVDERESPRQAAARELHEETGIKVNDEELQFLGVAFTHADDTGRDRFNFCFTIAVDTLPELAIPNDEIDNGEWVQPSDIATRAGGRKSYAAFAEVISGSKQLGSYIDVAEAYPKTI